MKPTAHIFPGGPSHRHHVSMSAQVCLYTLGTDPHLGFRKQESYRYKWAVSCFRVNPRSWGSSEEARTDQCGPQSDLGRKRMQRKVGGHSRRCGWTRGTKAQSQNDQSCRKPWDQVGPGAGMEGGGWGQPGHSQHRSGVRQTWIQILALLLLAE